MDYYKAPEPCLKTLLEQLHRPMSNGLPCILAIDDLPSCLPEHILHHGRDDLGHILDHDIPAEVSFQVVEDVVQPMWHDPFIRDGLGPSQNLCLGRIDVRDGRPLAELGPLVLGDEAGAVVESNLERGPQHYALPQLIIPGAAPDSHLRWAVPFSVDGL